MDTEHTGQIHDILYDQVEWTLVRITDPIKWSERCRWIEINSSCYQDHTNWALWQIGQGDIEFYVPKRDALMYYLKWD